MVILLSTGNCYMSTLYLTEQGSVLAKRDERLVVEKTIDGVVTKLADIPLIKIDTILIYGNVQITTQAISVLLERGIETAFLSMNGKLKGQLTPIKSKNIVLRMKQYERYHDKEFRLKVAKTIVKRKIQNSISLIEIYRANYPDEEMKDIQLKLSESLESLERKTEVQTVLGVEGIASVLHFRALAKMFKGELQFCGRNRRPPQDEINSLLSLGYIMVMNEINSLLDAKGFDPYIGFLHSIDYGRPSLALDILEEFRIALVDRFVLFLVNKRILQRKDFERRTEEGMEGIYLTRDGLKRFFYEYEKRLKDTTLKPNVSFRDIFKSQTEKMAKTIVEGEEYEPFRMTMANDE